MCFRYCKVVVECVHLTKLKNLLKCSKNYWRAMNVTQHSIVSHSTGVETLDSAKYTNKF